MARVDLLSTNFTGGELSPRLYGRPDLEKYGDSVKEARDCIVMQHGGVTSRPGTDYLGEVKASASQHRLVPFVRDTSNAFVLEFGNLLMRVWKNGALVEASPGVPYELVTPYSTAQVLAMDFSQGADTMLIAHPSHPLYRLRRFSDARWVIDAAPLDPAPFDEIGSRFAVVVTLGALTGSTTATAASSTWLASDVGRTITHNGGEAEITGYTSATVVSVTVTSTFASVTLAANEWVLTASPQTTCTPTHKEPVGKVTTLTLANDGWRAADVGKWVTVNGGLLEITAYSSATAVSARIETLLNATVAAEAASWTLEGPVWNAFDGYPSTVTFHEQRTVAGATANKSQTLWGSRSGLFYDFTKGTADDDSYSFELSSDEVNTIIFLSSNRDLMALTYGGEWTISGGVEKPITPTSVRARLQNKAGADPVRPEQVGDDLFYAQRGGEVLRALGYRIELAGYASEEASTFSEHIAARGIEELSFAQYPQRVQWLRLSDGTYAAMTVSREQQLRAFTHCTPGGSGFVESIATIPEGTDDATYLIVRRTVNGSTKRYVERMRWDAYTDCTKTVTLSPASATVTGLGYLEGKTVVAVADGVDLGDFTVTSGAITLTRSADSVVVGLRYTPHIVMLAPEFGTGMGVSIGGKVSAGKVTVLFKDTIGCDVNGQELPFRQLGGAGEPVLDTELDPFSGWVEVSNLGWSRESGEITIEQTQAYPWTVLAVVRRMSGNPG